MTQRLDEACEGLEQGDKNALVNAIVQVNTSIQESVLMLKGFETKQENLEASRAASVEKAESETGKGSQTADKKSRQGAKPGSVRGSMFDLTADQGAKSPIPEGEETGEEGLNGSPAHNDIDEPNAPEPVNTMDLGNTFNQLILKKDEEEEQVEFVEQSEIRLMLFPSQIRKIGSLIALLAYYRDLLQRLHDWAAEEHAEKLTSSYIYKSQLQYSFLPDSKAVEVKCLHLTFDYDFEYQGSADREVISPVCERVFVNLALAFKEHFGSIISGPMVCYTVFLSNGFTYHVGNCLVQLIECDSNNSIFYHYVY
ncbi:hypothetical protein EB796_010184 [Bugula neritina]|uniref:Uncharacterized protein n=1 Tax=Bugula neritina TaxID=10212 RepID=A0A7J7JYU4_BUGNE|nr:hypothetical protein EB796_010184 [Bugula neritina]